MVNGYEGLIRVMTNDERDRHVLAAAVRCGAHVTADEFLEHQYHLDPDSFINVLTEQAATIRWTLPHLISRHVPSLSSLIKVK